MPRNEEVDSTGHGPPAANGDAVSDVSPSVTAGVNRALLGCSEPRRAAHPKRYKCLVLALGKRAVVRLAGCSEARPGALATRRPEQTQNLHLVTLLTGQGRPPAPRGCRGGLHACPRGPVSTASLSKGGNGGFVGRTVARCSVTRKQRDGGPRSPGRGCSRWRPLLPLDSRRRRREPRCAWGRRALPRSEMQTHVPWPDRGWKATPGWTLLNALPPRAQGPESLG